MMKVKTTENGTNIQNVQVLDTFMITKLRFNEKLSGYQPCQFVKWRKSQRFKEHICPRLEDTDQFSLYKIAVKTTPHTNQDLSLGLDFLTQMTSHRTTDK
jgi:hypothetical protein